jgi:histidinol-phosphate phosphatase family protein
MSGLDSRRIVFLDKDGTLISNKPYNADPRAVTLVPGAEEALGVLRDAGLAIAVITNQPGVAFGCFSEDALGPVRDRIAELVAPVGVSFRGLYYCPHHPGGTVAQYAVDCDCRKPRSGLLVRAAAALAVDLRRSWMVGDILDDVEAGARVGCRTALVDNGGETEWVAGPFRRPNVVARTLAEAANAIVAWPHTRHGVTLARPNAECL